MNIIREEVEEILEEKYTMCVYDKTYLKKYRIIDSFKRDGVKNEVEQQIYLEYLNNEKELLKVFNKVVRKLNRNLILRELVPYTFSNRQPLIPSILYCIDYLKWRKKWIKYFKTFKTLGISVVPEGAREVFSDSYMYYDLNDLLERVDIPDYFSMKTIKEEIKNIEKTNFNISTNNCALNKPKVKMLIK